MAATVIEKPMQVTMVKAEPLFSATAVCATMEENCGESATTENPQINRKEKNNTGGNAKLNAANKQQQKEISIAVNATFALPRFIVIYPPATHPTAPTAIMANDHKGIFKA